ncbi:histidinol-phosphate transaminase [Actinotalea fermentans]|uniref:histidinol-phosphate transaminase n=1 Tax=Actinotalea fermentans TaxID=43671 RepID=UPI00051F4411|nr:histidinol-phosphate transaminase [Actinotalea fermentans]KGM14965.1 aminotransferase [Actinotalea fermentans ATCC 43279 = JCM 9966 = DSM 3133]
MTGPAPRRVVQQIPAYVPGARPGADGAYKLSSNENPFPPLDGVREAVARASADLNRYPDMYASDLVAALAARHGLEPAWVVAGCGSVAVLAHVLEAFCDAGDEVVHAWRSFEAYPIAVSLQGAVGVRVPVDAAGRHDLPAMAAAVGPRTRVVLVCTPNNPTGPAVHADELEAFLDAVPRDVLVVLDEAYVEFVRDADAADGLAALRARENVVVLRTFSKAYGLAGLRVGYALAHPDVAAAIRTAATPFGVNQLAEAAALASLEAEPALAERVAAVVAERERVLAGLRAQGWDVPESQANFVWLATGERTVDLAADARAHGLLVRPFAGEGIRISIGEPAANDRVLEVAATWR